MRSRATHMASNHAIHSWRVGFFGCGLFSLGYLFWYWQTPFGQVPVLDERENLELAAAIAEGRLSPEPFYRAMGYPLVLAGLIKLGLPMPYAATGFGVVLHLVNTALTAALARRVFRRPAAGGVAALLHGMNPVLLFYATQILDGTLANTLFLAGLLALGAVRSAGWSAALASVAWAAAAAIRPQFLGVWLCLGPLAWLMRGGENGHGSASRWGWAGSLAGIGVLLTIGLLQLIRTGEFRILPTQGAYNLWASNRPGAHGRYFEQSYPLMPGAAHINPTRAETFFAYEDQVGRPAVDLDEANRYWTSRLRQSIVQDPAGWLGRFTRRVYYLLNDFDQYNNKSYSFHRERSPLLRYNPLSWGIILVTAVLGTSMLATIDRRAALAWGSIAAVVGLSVALTFVSGRFRLPLHALACVLGGGIVCTPCWWARATHGARLALVLGLAAVAGVTFSRLWGVHDESPHVQDHLLAAAAAAEVGDDLDCWVESGQALSLSPAHPDALAWRVTSYFNLLLAGAAPPDGAESWIASSAQSLALGPNRISGEVLSLAGVALWRSGARDHADTTWKTLAARGSDNAKAALILTGEASAGAYPEAMTPRDSSGALAVLVRRLFSADEATHHAAADTVRRLFGPGQHLPQDSGGSP